MKYLILLLAVLILSGCGFARRDVEVYDSIDLIRRESTTIWTLFKEIKLGPYQSKNNAVALYTPWFLVKAGEE